MTFYIVESGGGESDILKNRKIKKLSFYKSEGLQVIK